MDEYICEEVVLESHVDELTGVTTETVGLGRPRERVVRCRDCRRSFEERGELWCRGIVGPPVEPDGFCAWGERTER